MKNQYFGDINDYRKYGLIRSILRAGDFRLLVAWMLTPDDDSNDGNIVEYLAKPKQWKNLDPTLYEGLQRLMRLGVRRDVGLIENTNLLPSANYYSSIVPDAASDRSQWMRGLIDASGISDLVFLDPDNGFEVKARPYGRKRSSKYVYWREINDLWAAKKSLLVYQHFPMEKRLGFIQRMLSELREHAQGAFVEAFSTPYVVFFLALQPPHQRYHSAIVDDVQKNWGSQIQHWELYAAERIPPSDQENVAAPAMAAGLVSDIRGLIAEAKAGLAATVNAALTMLYWRIGQRIRTDVLQGERAEYGEQIVATLAQQLEAEHGRGFSSKNLRHMLRFAESFPDTEIVSTLSRQLAWSHFLEIIYLKDDLQRDFYAEMCRLERWSVRTLRQRVDSMLYERTALSRRPESLIQQELATLRESDQLSPDLVLKDPYVLDFLGLRDRYLEKDLEDAILRELENFLLELGAGFTFVARQKRLQIDNDDFYIDLLFYNRRLKRLVAIDLKLGEFKAADKGQMELYLRWLAKHEQEPDEAPPLGIILCTGKKHEQIELLELDQTGIHVAEYLTGLPPRHLLERKLHEAVTRSKARLENQMSSAGDEPENLATPK